MSQSDFQKALERGMHVDADLRTELDPFEEHHITSDDAMAICKALKSLPNPVDYGEGVLFTTLSTLLGYFQTVAQENPSAYKVLYEHGIPELCRIFDSMVAQPEIFGEPDDLIKLLKMLAWYQHPIGTERIIQAALMPFKPDDYIWHVTLDAFAKGHPHRGLLFQSLSQKIPPSFLGVSLLDCANRAALEDGNASHPFDSDTGHRQLQSYLTLSDPSEFSYAHSATTALPFISEPARTQLMALAMDHVDHSITLQAATSSARLGSEAGLRVLSRFAMDVRFSMQAVANLVELGRLDHIPAVAMEPEFRAKAEFAHWLRHPNELGRPPTSLSILDHREFQWPTNGERKSLYLIQYKLLPEGGCELDEADTDCGMVGSVTFSLFGANNLRRPPEDVYAIHCAWEMEVAKHITETDIASPAVDPSIRLTIQGRSLQDPEFCCAYLFSDALHYPNRQVVLYRGTLDEDSGWLVSDGPRTAWYPESEQPDGTRNALIAKLHIGRVLLGLDQPVDRNAYLEEDNEISPELVVRVYEELLRQADTEEAERRATLLEGYGPVDNHFRRYLIAKQKLTQRSPDSVLAETYEWIFSLCEKTDASVLGRLFNRFSVIPKYLTDYIQAKVATAGASQDVLIAAMFERFLSILQRTSNPGESKLLDTLGPLADKFDWFMNAFHATGQSSRLPEFVRYFGQFWTKPITDLMLGRTAYAIGEYELAESFLSKLAQWKKSQLRFPELSLLADIWYRSGRSLEAEELIRTCIENLVREIATCEYKMDLESFQEKHHQHVTMFTQLFPEKVSTLPPVVLPKSPLS